MNRTVLKVMSVLTLFAALMTLLFVHLGGVNSKGPLSNIYLSKNRPGNGYQLKWYFYRVCRYRYGEFQDCSSIKVPYPFSPNGRTNDSYAVGTKLGYGFSLLSLALTLICLIWATLSVCLKKMPDLSSAILVTFTMFFNMLGLFLLIGFHTHGVLYLNDRGYNAQIGPAAYTLLCVSVLLLIISDILYWVLYSQQRKQQRQMATAYMYPVQPSGGGAYNDTLESHSGHEKRSENYY